MNIWIRRLVLVGVVLLVAGVAPKLVNWFLILILVGLVLGHWAKFQNLTRLISNITGDKSEGSK